MSKIIKWSGWDSSQIIIENCRTNQHTACDSVQFVIRVGNGKKQTLYHYLKKGSRNKSDNYKPVSLTSVICKLLERLIKDHLVDFLVTNK